MSTKLPPTLRNNKTFRISIISVLILIVVAMLIFGAKMKGLLLVALVLLVGALGLQITDWDVDLGKLWETGSLIESRVTTQKGLKIFGETCLPGRINCSNFKTQSEAQTLYDTCADQIGNDNAKNSDEMQRIDIYGLDGNKNGIVCEHLPQTAQ